MVTQKAPGGQESGPLAVAPGVGYDRAISREPIGSSGAEAVRGRIDLKYLLGLALTDPGFDFSVLSEFRSRQLAGQAEMRLLDKLLEQCRSRGLVKARGQQRTDATHVLAAIRVMNRLGPRPSVAGSRDAPDAD